MPVLFPTERPRPARDLGLDRCPEHLRRCGSGSHWLSRPHLAVSQPSCLSTAKITRTKKTKNHSKTRASPQTSAQLWRFRCTPWASQSSVKWPGPLVPASSVSGPQLPCPPPLPRPPLPRGSGSLSHTSWLEAASSYSVLRGPRIGTIRQFETGRSCRSCV